MIHKQNLKSKKQVYLDNDLYKIKLPTHDGVYLFLYDDNKKTKFKISKQKLRGRVHNKESNVIE